MKKLIAVFLTAAVTLSGCSGKDKEKMENMPPDTPWNREIMETENGYYHGSDIGIGFGSLLSLRYTEKSNGTDIYLCAKPECSHEGEESCTATYKNLWVSNYILYEGNIYFSADTSDDETQGISLYRASLDGTALDKICDVRRLKYAVKEDQPNFHVHDCQTMIIHKGYAYIPYTLGNKSTDLDIIETGMAKVNILNGDVEILFSDNKFQTRTNYTIIGGINDYIYYTVYSSNWGEYGFYRYNIKNGQSEKITGELGELANDKSGHYGVSGVTENAVYITHYDRDVAEIIGFDSETFERNGLNLELLQPKSNAESHYDSVNYYDNKIFILTMEYVKIYSDKGELLGSSKWCNFPKDKERVEGSDGYLVFYCDYRGVNISDGKVYIGLFSNMELKGLDFDSSTRDGYGYTTEYCCPIEDIIAGKGSWTKAYIMKM